MVSPWSVMACTSSSTRAGLPRWAQATTALRYIQCWAGGLACGQARGNVPLLAALQACLSPVSLVSLHEPVQLCAGAGDDQEGLL